LRFANERTNSEYELRWVPDAPTCSGSWSRTVSGPSGWEPRWVLVSGSLPAAHLALLYRTSPNDVTVLAAVAMTLVPVAFAASLLPARWATRADPASVLRTQ